MKQYLSYIYFLIVLFTTFINLTTADKIDSVYSDIVKSFKLRKNKSKGVYWKLLNYRNDNSYVSQYYYDVLMFYKTFFPENKYFEDGAISFPYDKQNTYKLSKNELEKIEVIKNIIIFIARNEVICHSEINGALLRNRGSKVCNFPIASLLSHGGRITVVLDNYLRDEYDYIFNDLFENKLHKRYGSPYGLEEKKGIVLEYKLGIFERFSRIVGNTITLDYYTSDYGMTFSFGGFGNTWPYGFKIGNDGIPVDNNLNEIKGLQHGFLTVRKKDNINAFIFGLEPSEWDKTGMFAETPHTIETSSTDYTVTGGKVWKNKDSLFNDSYPNEIGGKAIFIQKEHLTVKYYKEKIHSIKNEEMRKLAWWIILSLNVTNANSFLSIRNDDFESFLNEIYNKY